jgi:hypothetical protein
MTATAPAPVALSLGEVESLARKAAKGAGYPWALADAAGAAARGVAGLGGDPSAALLSLFARIAAGPALRDFAPQAPSGDWQARGGVLCPIQAGALMVDLARDFPDSGQALREVWAPALILAAAADVARLSSLSLTVAWRGGLVTLGEDGAALSKGVAKLLAEEVADLYIHPGGDPLTPAAPARRAWIAPDRLARLEAFAARTYAPATEASRTAGAGAGLSDND